MKLFVCSVSGNENLCGLKRLVRSPFLSVSSVIISDWWQESKRDVVIIRSTSRISRAKQEIFVIDVTFIIFSLLSLFLDECVWCELWCCQNGRLNCWQKWKLNVVRTFILMIQNCNLIAVRWDVVGLLVIMCALRRYVE